MMWLMLQQDEPEDFVIATGQQTSVREFVRKAASEIGISLRFEGSGLDERAYDQNGRTIVQVDPRYFRPTEVDSLLGDSSKAREKLKWAPKVTFEELVKEMVWSDLKLAELEKESGATSRKVHHEKQ